MEYQNITNLLGTTTDEMPRFITKKWVEVHHQQGSSSCYFSEAYIVVKRKITVTNPDNNAYNKKLAFKNNAPFVSCILKIIKTIIDNAEDLDVVMSMHNLLEYSKNYSKTTGSFWNYYRDEPDSGADNNINYSIKNSKSFDYKTREKDEKDVEIVVSLKYLSNFWRALDIPLINCEINLILTWSENCVLTSKATRDADPDANPAIAAINANVTIKIKDAKLYVPVVTLPNEKDKILLKKLRTGFKRTIK